MPLVQLVVLGHAFGGQVKHLKVGLVDQDHGVPALKLAGARQRRRAPTPAPSTWVPLRRPGRGRSTALRDGQRQRRADDPARASRAARSTGDDPHVALDRGQHRRLRRPPALAASFAGMMRGLRAPGVGRGRGIAARHGSTSSSSTRTCPTSSTCCPGTTVMSIFMMVMIGGGIIFIDDKARGLHEGYLVTPDHPARAHPGLQPRPAPSRAMLAGRRADHARFADRRRARPVRTRCACCKLLRGHRRRLRRPW